ncbi:exopolysaccharide biosynthesis polyprenyl glycosylphosphotransferase [Deinococcus yavapaiensis]|uniref:Undecaprenyl-phosphate galactose phosphotransferase WbaP/exopolysaccharide biosynthesis polyprenyl glycosylphosphotransferase n=1 Tax=Deinococcus yavapaiensis KR-236 TaxID=694435 RepID=A0A318SBL0_9DEIO|nr:exopolysaccharide biosynthesis polyprenyl glycosylphosphotransferase [Deinococcus yavapaiensis]PYE55744.1 Undecaprenyl-phosphate galactose phosphotransferase WbaP/exopolysaccharide biosynthesis polyprenyl glycosylphosphotransferase [Deinococcus yavapaiensis KR-236]
MQILWRNKGSKPSTLKVSAIYRRQRFHNGMVLAVSDVVTLAGSFELAARVVGAISHATTGITSYSLEGLPVLAAWLLGAWSLRLLPSWGMSPPEELKRLTTLLALTLGLSVLLALAARQDALTLSTIGVACVFAWPLLLLVRASLKHLLVRDGAWGVPTVIYGGARTGALVIQSLREYPGYGYLPVGVFDDDLSLQGTRTHGLPVLGTASDVSVTAPVAVLAMPGVARERMLALLEGPLSQYHRVVVIPDLFGLEALWAQARDVGGVLGLELSGPSERPMSLMGKRVFDVVLTVLSAPLWVPLCAVLALLIWLEDRAHPLFLQRRIGLHGKTFLTWKFRTMVPDAEGVLQRHLAANPALRAEWEANHKLQDDPRVTRIGRILRKYSLDEVPQLVNVLIGEMSLIGPRPLPEYHVQALSHSVQLVRTRVRPGMTGLWQVSGRSEAGNAGMERWDPYYVNNCSLWLDLVILARTVGAVLKSSGAY